MKVMAIDLALKKTGIAIIDKSTNTPIHYETFDSKPKGDCFVEYYSEAHMRLAGRVKTLLLKHDIDKVVIEFSTIANGWNKSKYQSKKTWTAQVLGMTLGVIALACHATLGDKAKVITTTPNEWQLRLYKRVLSKGESKALSRKYVKDIFGIDEADDNITDALLIAYLSDKLEDRYRNKVNTQDMEKRKTSNAKKRNTCRAKINSLITEEEAIVKKKISEIEMKIMKYNHEEKLDGSLNAGKSQRREENKQRMQVLRNYLTFPKSLKTGEHLPSTKRKTFKNQLELWQEIGDNTREFNSPKILKEEN